MGILYGSQGKYLRDPDRKVAKHRAQVHARVNQPEPPLPQLDSEIPGTLGDDSPERRAPANGSKEPTANPPALSH